MNKYTHWYNSIIESARTRTFEGYKERHHIIPRSLGGSNDKHNLVDLTAREHFICHWLLVKIYTGEDKSKMIYALNGMKRNGKDNDRYETAITSRVYAKLKQEFSKIHSETMKGRVPSNKGKPMSENQKKKLSIQMTGRTVDPEVVARRVKSQTGQKRTQETKDRIRASLTGFKRGPMSEEHKQKRSDSLKGKAKSADAVAKRAETLKRLAAEGTHHSMVKVTCPHCTKEVTKLVYGRLHGHKCSANPDK
jgi:hypothetical protein